MQVPFYKYQGTGNDFIIIDDRALTFPKKNTLISRLCHRRFGIGADGLILIKNDAKSDFFMNYFNADGQESSFCGNGARCAVAFSKKMGIFSEKSTYFKAADGAHHGSIEGNCVSLKMKDVLTIEDYPKHVFLDTGSPHHVLFTKDVNQIDVVQKGSAIRYGAPYFDKGANVNFAEVIDNKSLRVRTYERGVENETLSCGTGATAVALAAYYTRRIKVTEVKIHTQGGLLSVGFQKVNDYFMGIWLHGEVFCVFQGVVSV